MIYNSLNVLDIDLSKDEMEIPRCFLSVSLYVKDTGVDNLAICLNKEGGIFDNKRIILYFNNEKKNFFINR